MYEVAAANYTTRSFEREEWRGAREEEEGRRESRECLEGIEIGITHTYHHIQGFRVSSSLIRHRYTGT